MILRWASFVKPLAVKASGCRKRAFAQPIMKSALVVFDFDHTLIDCNSDPWVVDHLGASDLMRSLRPSLSWTDLMDTMMTEIHARGNAISDIEDSLRKIPVQPEMIRAIQTAHSEGCMLRVISDANVFFIKTVLASHDLEKFFTEVHSNPAHVDAQGVLRIRPYHSDPPHSCSLCPPNMCKGLILDNIRASAASSAGGPVIYIGDGRGDYCPCLRLQEGDHVLAKQGYPLWRLVRDNCELMKAKVHGWSSAKDVEACLSALLFSHTLC